MRWKNPDGPQPKGGKSKAVPKAKVAPKTRSKRKRPADEEEDDNEKKLEAEDDDAEAPPTKRGRKAPVSSSSKGKGKQKAEEGGEEEDNASDDAEDEAPAGKSPPELLLANKWEIETGPDPTGWWMSEKLDGVRFVVLLSFFILNISLLGLFAASVLSMTATHSSAA